MQSMNMQKSNKNTLGETLTMIFVDFGLLRSPYCKISYLHADIKIRVKIWQPTYDSVCEDNSLIHGKCQHRFYQTFTNVFLSSHVLTFLTFFLNFFYLNVYYVYAHKRGHTVKRKLHNVTGGGN